MDDATPVNAADAGTIVIGDDLTVNRLGFGAMRLTGRGVWGEPPDRAAAKAVLRRAVDRGVNFIDTADSYGPHISETLIAEALHPYPDDLVIATKGGLERPSPGEWTANGRPDHLRAACEGSLRRLRLEQIPLYQFHRPDPQIPIEESIGALVALQEQGKLRHIGLSNVSPRHVRRLQRLTRIVSVQNRYNLADRGSQSLVELCEHERMLFIPWAPIQDLHDDLTVSGIAERHGVTAVQVVLAWMLASSSAIVPIPGTSSLDHLEMNVAAAGLRLSADETEALTRSARPRGLLQRAVSKLGRR